MKTEEYAYPYRYERTTTAAAAHERHGALAPEAESGESARMAGRVMLTRSHGKVAFADLLDGSGRIQLFAQHAILGDEGMAEFATVNVGDIVGAEGEIIKTRRGELSVNVRSTTMLAPCLRSMPDTFHGIANIETRYRQRYLDLLLTEDARRALDGRARANSSIREFLDARGFVEVETPLLQPIASGAVARPFRTHHNALDIDLYLRIAPELFLKRLLVGGLDRVYELNRCFRNEGVNTQHNPEFTMLECYETYVDYDDTMALVEELVRAIAKGVTGAHQLEIGETTVDLAEPFRRMTMFEAIAEHGGGDLLETWTTGDHDAIATKADALGVHVDPKWPPGKVLAEVFEAVAERKLIAPTFVVGFPKDISPLAKDHRSIPGFTEQTDLILGGVELAPIYSELNDPAEQRRRFEQQARERSRGDDEAMSTDEDFIEALSYGMPPAGGFGLGIDRLLALCLGLSSLREVILFPTLKPESRPG